LCIEAGEEDVCAAVLGRCGSCGCAACAAGEWSQWGLRTTRQVGYAPKGRSTLGEHVPIRTTSEHGAATCHETAPKVAARGGVYGCLCIVGPWCVLR